MKRGGGFGFDNDLLMEQQRNINKNNALKEFDDMEDSLNSKNNHEE
jgi:hypothetical protein